MPGFVSSISNSNEAVFAKNADFSGNSDPSELNGLRTNGQMWIGSTATNVGNTHVNVGNITSTGGTIAVTYASPNINLEAVSSGGSFNGFQAYLSGNVSNVTGDGTVYTIPFNTTSYDIGSNFNTGTGTYTAPTTGYYLFTGVVFFTATDPSQTQGTINLVTTATNFQLYTVNAYAMAGNAVAVLPWSKMCAMTAGDTATIVLTVQGTSKNVIVGGLLTFTTFEGQFLG